MSVKLYLHFGLYKTGSSFIQAICANNRKHLQANGYFFPKSLREDDMISGKISPGNGNGISKKTKENDLVFCTKLIGKWKQLAIENGCNKILISDEALIHGYVSDGGLACLIKAANDNQISDIFSFAFLRDPIEHCLSTYKHRAKRGNLPEFSIWVSSLYETPIVLKKFYDIFRNFSVEWMFSKYNKSGAIMADVFFSRWLQIDMPSIPVFMEVNTSLTLSEIEFLRCTAKYDGEVIPYIYDQMIRVPFNEKDDNNILTRTYRQMAHNFLLNYEDTFNNYNNLLNNGEKLFLEEVSEEYSSNFIHYSFSVSQMNAINRGFLDGNTFFAKGKKVIIKLKRLYRYKKLRLFK